MPRPYFPDSWRMTAHPPADLTGLTQCTHYSPNTASGAGINLVTRQHVRNNVAVQCMPKVLPLQQGRLAGITDSLTDRMTKNKPSRTDTAIRPRPGQAVVAYDRSLKAMATLVALSRAGQDLAPGVVTARGSAPCEYEIARRALGPVELVGVAELEAVC